MDFDDRVRLDPSQVRDVRGRRGAGRGLAVGGGGLDTGAYSPGVTSDLAERCQTGADADRDQDCRILATVNSVQAYWDEAFDASGRRYEVAQTELFTGGTTTSCGSATSAVGPFYCPADQGVYLDLAFFDDLRTRFGANGGPFAEAYVVGHQYGDHVQNLVGTNAQARRGDQDGPQSAAVRLEHGSAEQRQRWFTQALRTGDPACHTFGVERV